MASVPLPRLNVAPPPEAPARPALSVLLALSSPAARALVIGVLEERGHRGQSVADANTALAICQDSAIDLVCLDPQFSGRDGFELCRSIRRLKLARPPVVLMVVSPEFPAQLQEALAAGADGYLSAPLQLAVLQARLDVIERQRARAASSLPHADRPSRTAHGARSRDAVDRRAGQLLNALPDAVLALDDGGHVVWSNPAAERRFGTSRDRLAGKAVETLLRCGDGAPLPHEIDGALEAGTQRVGAMQGRRDDGSTFAAQATFVPLTGFSKSSGWLVTVRESSQDAFEALQHRESAKMGAVASVASGIANDFNNALAAVGSSIEAARLLLPSTPDPIRLELDGAMSATRNAARLVRRLLHFSRPAPSRRTPVNPRLLMEEAAVVLRLDLEPKVTLVTRFEHGDWNVMADVEQIVDLLVSMGYNAREAMPNGGILTLRTAKAPASAAPPVPGQARDFVRLEVSDTGIGIPPDQISRIFEPMFTTKTAGVGAGMGLATAWNVLRQHDGGITVESAPGKGSTFRIYLPQAAAEVAIATEPRARPAPTTGPNTILLVDDEPAVRRPLRRALEHHGYAILEARDGVEALEVYQSRRDRIGLVILDEKMPRMAGHQVLAEMRRIDPLLPIVMTTGYSPESDDLPSPAALADGYLKKPYELAKLTGMVRKLLDQGAEPALS
jgi:PAS domain S-box-containing protein